MRASVVGFVLLGAVLGCTSLTPEGAKVEVYEADLATPADSRKLPDGCRRVASPLPVQEMEVDRLGDDPYRLQRNETGAHGGNVLLVLSDKIRRLPRTDCAPSDNSYDCRSRSQNWYLVEFESYGCDAPALYALAQIPAPERGGVAAWWPFGRKKTTAPAAPAAAAPPAAAGPASAPAPAADLSASELRAKVLVLQREGVGEDVLVAYVRSHPPSRALTADEILEWKKSGISDSVIAAALAPFESAR
jgi:hypothetical protein